MALTTSEVAEMLEVSERRVRQMAESGVLNPVRRGARPMRFREDDVHAFSLTRHAANAARLTLGYPVLPLVAEISTPSAGNGEGVSYAGGE